MKPLSETNPYLRDPEARRRMLEENAYQSSVFEGARGLQRPAIQPDDSPKRRSSASKKKLARAS
ncbi:MAG: hypothetical protein M3Y28_11735 [Armatimonadota bacterium]|nr:hypothetical protein [Armatimonadota bacterium]